MKTSTPKMKWLRCLPFIGVLCSGTSTALVTPDDANEELPEWFARVYYGTTSTDSRSQFCMGALVGSRWVVSALGCFNDPLRVLAGYPGDDTPRYYIRLGRDGDYIEVEQRFTSADQGMVIYQLVEDVDTKPLRVSNLSATELAGEEVTLLAMQSTAPLQHPLYNPGPGREGKCTVDGQDFRNDSVYCFVYTYPVRHSVVVKADARVIDPLGPERPIGGINDAINPVTNGSRLYLSFTGRGYTCMEDMGLPITRLAEDGERELVGVVNASGGVFGVPICGPTIANWFSVASHYRDYFMRVQAEASLRALCPSAPTPRVEVAREGGSVTLRWNDVPQADGYRVIYTPAPGEGPLRAHDVGASNSLSTTLDVSLQFEVAVQAYNESCTSPLSDTIYLNARTTN